ncbi:hypothetical protein SAMN05880580_104122 [Priestia flexa]|nr:hypothetical protein SAMN05880580_104122 [Priestia flexa]
MMKSGNLDLLFTHSLVIYGNKVETFEPYYQTYMSDRIQLFLDIKIPRFDMLVNNKNEYFNSQLVIRSVFM